MSPMTAFSPWPAPSGWMVMPEAEMGNGHGVCKAMRGVLIRRHDLAWLRAEIDPRIGAARSTETRYVQVAKKRQTDHPCYEIAR